MALSRNRKIIIASSTVAVLLLIVAISIYARRGDDPEVTTVRVETRPELRSTVIASGEIRPVQFINLTSEVAGRIEQIYVNPGDQVTRNQPLIRLDPTQLQTSQEAQFAVAQASLSDVQNARTQVITAENNVAQAQQGLTVAETAVASARQQVVAAQTNVDRAQVDLNTGQRELKRTTDLIESGVASRFEYDAAKDRYDQSQVALRTAQAQLQQQKLAVQEATARVDQQRITVRDARNGVERARTSVGASEARANQQQALLRGQSDQRAKATQVAPLAGVVVDIPARVGQFAIANFQSTSLMTIADMSTVIVKVNVDETEIAEVEVGHPTEIKVDALGERKVEGIVTQKNPLALGKSDTQQQTTGIRERVNVQEAKEFEVVIELREMPDELRNSLRPGMSATATITTKVKKDVVAVPLQAVVEQTATPAATPGASPAGGGNAASAQGGAPAGAKPVKGVYLMQNNRARFVEVTTGITGESDIEITSGVPTGAEVITGPSRVLRTLKNDATVKKQTRKPGAGSTNSNEATS